MLAPDREPITNASSGRSGRRYAIVGAGAAGLCCAKYLIQAGFTNVTIFEIGTQIGGLWCYGNDSGLSSAYKTLHINSPKHLTSFNDFPFPPEVQMFPDHRDMHEYLVAYAKHFDLVKHIRFRSRVVDVRPAANFRPNEPEWEVELEGGLVEVFDRVMVANGHLSTPMHVDIFKKEFGGEYLHTHDYREPAPYVGKRVCIVGAGNSACDIASDICATAARTVLIARSGVVIVPKTICGVPFHDVKAMIEKRWIPERLQRRIMSALVYLIQGRMTDLGFKPLEKRAHGTSNATLVQHICYRRVTVKQGIEKIDGRMIRFSDGNDEEFDVLIAGTGYLLEFPFLSDQILTIENNSVDLYKRIVPPNWAGLYFVGLLNTSTVSLPFMHEQQMKWILAFEEGSAAFPSPKEMQADIDAQRAFIGRLYSSSLRHTIEEVHSLYLVALRGSRKEGEKRAKRLQSSWKSSSVAATR